jgi:hypothetical protein
MPQKFTREDFLDALFYDYLKTFDGFVAVRSFGQVESKVSTRFFPNVDVLARERYPSDTQVFFGVCPRDRMKPGKEHVRHMTALWAGIDVGPNGYSGKEKHFSSRKQALAAMKEFPHPPSIIVISGSGIHVYWLLRAYHEITDIARVERILTEINRYFQCTSVIGTDSFMRLPDTKNMKIPSNPSPCYIEYMEGGLKYNLADFEGLDLRIVLPSKRPPKPIAAPQADPKKVTFMRDKVERMEAEAKASQANAAADSTVPTNPVPQKTGTVQSPAAPTISPEPPKAPMSAPAKPPSPDTPAAQPRTDQAVGSEALLTLSDESIQKLSAQLAADLEEKIADRVVEKLWDRFFKSQMGEADKSGV